MFQNVVVLVGRCITEPVVAQKGKTIYCRYIIKIPRPFCEEDDLFTVISFGKKAKEIARILNKGQIHSVQGILRSGKYVDQMTGRKVRTISIMAEKLSVYERDTYKTRTIEDVERELRSNKDDDILEHLEEGLEMMDIGEKSFGLKSIERSVEEMEVELGDPDIPR